MSYSKKILIPASDSKPTSFGSMDSSLSVPQRRNGATSVAFSKRAGFPAMSPAKVNSCAADLLRGVPNPFEEDLALLERDYLRWQGDTATNPYTAELTQLRSDYTAWKSRYPTDTLTSLQASYDAEAAKTNPYEVGRGKEYQATKAQLETANAASLANPLKFVGHDGWTNYVDVDPATGSAFVHVKIVGERGLAYENRIASNVVSVYNSKITPTLEAVAKYQPWQDAHSATLASLQEPIDKWKANKVKADESWQERIKASQDSATAWDASRTSQDASWRSRLDAFRTSRDDWFKGLSDAVKAQLWSQGPPSPSSALSPSVLQRLRSRGIATTSPTSDLPSKITPHVRSLYESISKASPDYDTSLSELQRKFSEWSSQNTTNPYDAMLADLQDSYDKWLTNVKDPTKLQEPLKSLVTSGALSIGNDGTLTIRDEAKFYAGMGIKTTYTYYPPTNTNPYGPEPDPKPLVVPYEVPYPADQLEAARKQARESLATYNTSISALTAPPQQEIDFRKYELQLAQSDWRRGVGIATQQWQQALGDISRAKTSWLERKDLATKGLASLQTPLSQASTRMAGVSSSLQKRLPTSGGTTSISLVPVTSSSPAAYRHLTRDQAAVLQAVASGESDVDRIAIISGLSVSDTTRALQQLQLLGRIKYSTR